MDLILNNLDHHILTPYVYPETWSEDCILRQGITMWLVLLVSAWVLYLTAATFAFYFLFDHSLMKHPKYLPNQARKEIIYAVVSLFFISFPTLACVLLEIRGFGKLYYSPDEYGWTYFFSSIFFFILFSDVLIYIIHRAFHESKWMYKHIHKPHHRWVIATPYASHAFHPVDGFLQSLPYHLFVFLFPFNKIIFVVFFLFVNFWTISIHDSTYIVPSFLENFINGSAHHTDHHSLFIYNYGQYFTFCDKLFGTHLKPSNEKAKDTKSA